MRVHGDGAVGCRAAAEGDQRSHAPGAASVAVDGGQLTTLRRRRMLEEVGALLVDSMCDRIYFGTMVSLGRIAQMNEMHDD
jgi:hypothetical protein